MKVARHMLTALAAHLPCRVSPEPVPSFACNCMELYGRAELAWNEGLARHYRRVGLLFSPVMGSA